MFAEKNVPFVFKESINAVARIDVTFVSNGLQNAFVEEENGAAVEEVAEEDFKDVDVE